MERASGVLMHVSSLPSKYGIGSFGKECFEFIDYIKSAGQKFWQVLPLNQTGFGNSPYQSCSANSLNPYFIDLEILKEEGLISDTDLKNAINEEKYVNFGWLYYTRYPLLKKAFINFDESDKDFQAFIKEGKHHSYALFMALKTHHNGKSFNEWDTEYKFRDAKALSRFEEKNKSEINFWLFLQFMAKKQWTNVKKYANDNGIKIIGDMPLYVAYDSVDVWENPQLFKLDKNLNPTKVAGVPPDYFSALGQLWGNPVYDYKEHKKQNFEWWAKRIERLLEKFDCIRIDHFRGLDRFYEIPFGKENALIGKWAQVPYKALFERLSELLNKNNVIAEDLGVMDDGVLRLLKYTGFPGMKVLDFAFDGNPDNPYLPKNVPCNCVCYTGTHDNETIASMPLNFVSDDAKRSLHNILMQSKKEFKVKGPIKTNIQIAKTVIELGFASKANLFIIPLSDVFLLGNDYRMNEPSTLSEQNWAVRFKKGQFKKSNAEYLRNLTIKYNR